MPEPSDTGIAAQLAEYWSAWDDVANQPESIPARAALASRAETLAETFRSAHAALTDMRDSLVKETKNIVAQVNSDAQGVADLNGKIIAAKTAGVDTGDLEDQRDLLVDRIAQATGAVARYDENGSRDAHARRHVDGLRHPHRGAEGGGRWHPRPAQRHPPPHEGRGALGHGRLSGQRPHRHAQRPAGRGWAMCCRGS